MNALEIAQAKADEVNRIRDKRQAAMRAAEEEEKRRQPLVAAWYQIWESPPHRYSVDYRRYGWLKWAKETADRILTFVAAVDEAGYSDRLPFMAQVTDYGEEHTLAWLYVLVAKQSGVDAIHSLILYSIPEGVGTIEPSWWAPFNAGFPGNLFFSSVEISDLICPNCGGHRTPGDAHHQTACGKCAGEEFRKNVAARAQDVLSLSTAEEIREEAGQLLRQIWDNHNAPYERDALHRLWAGIAAISSDAELISVPAFPRDVLKYNSFDFCFEDKVPKRDQDNLNSAVRVALEQVIAWSTERIDRVSSLSTTGETQQSNPKYAERPTTNAPRDLTAPPTKSLADELSERFDNKQGRLIIKILAEKLDRTVRWSELPDDAFHAKNTRLPETELQALKRIRKKLNEFADYEMTISEIEQTVKLSPLYKGNIAGDK